VSTIQTPDAQPLFRKSGGDQMPSSDQLDQLMQVTSPRTWMALTAMAVLVGAAIVWGFVGTIPTRVTASGILLNTDASGARQGLQAIVYAPPVARQHVGAGMAAHISPATAPPEEFGFIHGTVTAVSEVPATADAMTRVLEDPALVRTLSAGGPPFAVFVGLQPNPQAPGRYLWSTANGNGVTVTSGTRCDVTITVREQRPVELILPTIRRYLGV